ncbi:hypothetical protein [Duganella sp. P38]
MLEDTHHYFACREDKTEDNAMQRFRRWFFEQSGIADGNARAN